MKLQEKYCSCFTWQDTLIPCSHAIAVMSLLRRNVIDFLPPCYSVDNYKKFYSNAIPVISFNLLEVGNCKPPPYVKPRGRPNKKRIPSRWEESSKQTKNCSFCKESGHNILTCPQIS